ncbi:hypothetical protein CVT24_005103, partial [Panaeolus cyanescens]
AQVQVLVENNVFSNVGKPLYSIDTGYAVARGNDFGGKSNTAPAGNLNSVPYGYNLVGSGSVRSSLARPLRNEVDFLGSHSRTVLHCLGTLDSVAMTPANPLIVKLIGAELTWLAYIRGLRSKNAQAQTIPLTLAMLQPMEGKWLSYSWSRASTDPRLIFSTTGGSGGTVTTVTTLAALTSAVAGNNKKVVVISGTISGATSVKIGSNTSVVGKPGATLNGVGLTVNGNSNVIIRNLRINKVLASSGTGDAINIDIQYASKIWIDHNELWSDRDHDKDYYDGLLDVTHGCTEVTITYNKLHDHHKCSLVGADNSNTEDKAVTITYAYNHFYNIGSRMPSIRFGKGHIYNNLFENSGDGVNTRIGAQVLVENNVFSGVGKPIFSTDTGYAVARGNDFGGKSNSAPAGTLTSVPYGYSLVAAGSVRSSGTPVLEKRAGPNDTANIGYATTNGGTTGGSGGPVTTVSTLAALTSAVAGDAKKIVIISGSITGTGSIAIGSNTSVLGKPGAVLNGVGLNVNAKSNVIIRNIKINKVADRDAITLVWASKVWVDHVELWSDRDHDKDYYDGLIDITHACTEITVSYSKFHDHFKGSLVGASDSNTEDKVVTVTYAYNHFYNIGSRTPSIRFGKGHIYNNLFENNNDGINTRVGAQILVENNVFSNVGKPLYATDGGFAVARGNDFGGKSNTAPAGTLTSVPYGYSLVGSGSVRSSVSGAGATLSGF